MARSPRTTIVGGRPPEAAAPAFPVPTGLQRLLRAAAHDPGMLDRLAAERAAAASALGVALTPSERAILAAIPEIELRRMAAALASRAPAPGPRRQTAAAAVVALGGAALVGCPAVGGCQDEPGEEPVPVEVEPPGPPAGIRPDEPPVPPLPEEELPPPAIPELQEPPPADPALLPERDPYQPTRGIRPDIPPMRPAHPEMQAAGGAAPDVPRPSTRPMETEGGAAPDVPEEDEDEVETEEIEGR